MNENEWNIINVTLWILFISFSSSWIWRYSFFFPFLSLPFSSIILFFLSLASRSLRESHNFVTSRVIKGGRKSRNERIKIFRVLFAERGKRDRSLVFGPPFNYTSLFSCKEGILQKLRFPLIEEEWSNFIEVEWIKQVWEMEKCFLISFRLVWFPTTLVLKTLFTQTTFLYI